MQTKDQTLLEQAYQQVKEATTPPQETAYNRNMNNTDIYILIVESNRAFLGAYATREEAEQVAKAFRVPTEILNYSITMVAAE